MIDATIARLERDFLLLCERYDLRGKIEFSYDGVAVGRKADLKQDTNIDVVSGDRS